LVTSDLSISVFELVKITETEVLAYLAKNDKSAASHRKLKREADKSLKDGAITQAQYDAMFPVL
jgi:hypothetical protein